MGELGSHATEGVGTKGQLQREGGTESYATEAQGFREALSRFALEHADWRYFATITFRRAPRDAIAAASAVLRQVRRVPALCRPSSVFFGIENGRRGTPHMHALWGGAQADASWRWWKEWAFKRFGIARFYPYDARKGGAYYVTKYVAKESVYDAGTWGLWTFADLF